MFINLFYSRQQHFSFSLTRYTKITEIKKQYRHIKLIKITKTTKLLKAKIEMKTKNIK